MKFFTNPNTSVINFEIQIKESFSVGGSPFAPFKASFKDPFKTHPPMGIVSLFTTILNLILLHVLKFQKFTKKALLAGS